jgi:hypothetical protein
MKCVTSCCSAVAVMCVLGHFDRLFAQSGSMRARTLKPALHRVCEIEVEYPDGAPQSDVADVHASCLHGSNTHRMEASIEDDGLRLWTAVGDETFKETLVKPPWCTVSVSGYKPKSFVCGARSIKLEYKNDRCSLAIAFSPKRPAQYLLWAGGQERSHKGDQCQLTDSEAVAKRSSLDINLRTRQQDATFEVLPRHCDAPRKTLVLETCPRQRVPYDLLSLPDRALALKLIKLDLRGRPLRVIWSQPRPKPEEAPLLVGDSPVTVMWPENYLCGVNQTTGETARLLAGQAVELDVPETQTALRFYRDGRIESAPGSLRPPAEYRIQRWMLLLEGRPEDLAEPLDLLVEDEIGFRPVTKHGLEFTFFGTSAVRPYLASFIRWLNPDRCTWSSGSWICQVEPRHDYQVIVRTGANQVQAAFDGKIALTVEYKGAAVRLTGSNSLSLALDDRATIESWGGAMWRGYLRIPGYLFTRHAVPMIELAMHVKRADLITGELAVEGLERDPLAWGIGSEGWRGEEDWSRANDLRNPGPITQLVHDLSSGKLTTDQYLIDAHQIDAIADSGHRDDPLLRLHLAAAASLLLARVSGFAPLRETYFRKACERSRQVWFALSAQGTAATDTQRAARLDVGLLRTESCPCIEQMTAQEVRDLITVLEPLAKQLHLDEYHAAFYDLTRSLDTGSFARCRGVARQYRSAERSR